MKKCICCKTKYNTVVCITPENLFFKKYICISCLSAVNNEVYNMMYIPMQTLCPLANKDLINIKHAINDISDSNDCPSIIHDRLLDVSRYLLDIIDPYYRNMIKWRDNSVR